jgi:DNA-binding response OmpR family regulator
LIADPDAALRSLYREELFAGSDVVEASDGRDALVKALVRSPELVVTELHLPLLDGYALCEILRRDRMTADTSIIVVTSESRPPELQRALEAGADVVLPKLMPVEQLRAEMLRMLDRARSAVARNERSQQRTARLLSHSADLLVNGQLARKQLSSAGERLSRSYRRVVTTSPPLPPPAMPCPLCDQTLRYLESYVGGVSAKRSEQWDTLECATCGRFEYRHRTRRLRPVSNPERSRFPR